MKKRTFKIAIRWTRIIKAKSNPHICLLRRKACETWTIFTEWCQKSKDGTWQQIMVSVTMRWVQKWTTKLTKYFTTWHKWLTLNCKKNSTTQFYPKTLNIMPHTRSAIQGLYSCQLKVKKRQSSEVRKVLCITKVSNYRVRKIWKRKQWDFVVVDWLFK